jgi:hypothetical protein
MHLRSSPSLQQSEFRGGEHPPARPPDRAADRTDARFWARATAFHSLVLACLGFVTYGPAVSLEYGKADDYWLLAGNAAFSPESAAQVWIEAGRFVPALMSRWLFPSVDTVPELLLLRVLAIVALALTGVVLSLTTLRLVGSPRSWVSHAVALVVGCMAMVTPAAPVAATWAVMALQLWALPLALGAGLVATTQRRLLGLRWEVVSVVLVLLATFTYQPAAAACLLGVFMWSSLRWARQEPPHWRRPALVTAFLVVALAVNVGLVKLLDWAGNERVGGNGLGESAAWFILDLIPRTIAFSVPTTLNSAGWTMVVLIAALLSPMTLDRRFLALPASVVLAWLGAAGVLVPGELFASHRLVMTPQTVLWCGSAVCAAFTLRAWAAWRPRTVTALVVALAGGASVLLGVSSYRAYVYMAKPNAVDWASVQCVLRESQPLTDRSVLTVNPHTASVSPVHSYEYGGIATSAAWVLPDMVWLAAKAVDRDALPPKVNARDLSVVEISAGDSVPPSALRFEQDICGALTPES